jgi:hypothetical protein
MPSAQEVGRMNSLGFGHGAIDLFFGQRGVGWRHAPFAYRNSLHSLDAQASINGHLHFPNYLSFSRQIHNTIAEIQLVYNYS